MKDAKDYIRFDLGKEAKQYIFEKLLDGKPFSNGVAADLTPDTGIAHTYLPRGMSADELLSFRPGKPGISQWITLEHMIAYIDALLRANSESLVVFEDALGKRGEKWLSEAESNFSFYKDCVYHTLRSPESNAEAIDCQIRWSHGVWQNLAFITSLPEGMTIRRNEDISEDAMRLMVERTEVVISDAYDLDGYLFWEIRK